MAKTKKTPRPRAETPKGFADYFGADVTERKAMLDKIAQVYHAHGFDPLESAAVETVQALGKFLPDVDRPNDGVFAWQEDDDGDWLALRYDLTAPLARVYAQHRNDLPTPYRRYAMGPVWRNEKPGPGRFRQFYQCDADTVGMADAAGVVADAEMCMMLADALEAVGIQCGDYVIRVNNRKVLDGVLNFIGIAPDDERRPAIMRTIDKFDKVGEQGVLELLTTGREDSSGAFIDPVGIPIQNAQRVVQYLFQKSVTYNKGINAGRLASMHQAVGDSEIGNDGIKELEQIAKLVAEQGYSEKQIQIDTSVVRGLDYYTGPVFEAELIGDLARFGSVAGGGRYDDLVKRFTGQSVPATGISIGVDRLLAALRAKGKSKTDATGPVVVTVMDRERMADYQAMAAELRAKKIRAEVYLGNPKNFGNQLKYADKRASPVAIIQGSDEATRGVVQIKDLILGAKIAETATHEEWRDQPAQFEVPRDEMVAKVREILDRT